MGHHVIRQPDGRLAVWSTVVDDFIMIDASVDEVAEEHAEASATRAREEWTRVAQAVLDGTGRGMTWEEALALREEVHGAPFDIDAARRETEPVTTQTPSRVLTPWMRESEPHTGAVVVRARALLQGGYAFEIGDFAESHPSADAALRAADKRLRLTGYIVDTGFGEGSLMLLDGYTIVRRRSVLA